MIKSENTIEGPVEEERDGRNYDFFFFFDVKSIWKSLLMFHSLEIPLGSHSLFDSERRFL